MPLVEDGTVTLPLCSSPVSWGLEQLKRLYQVKVGLSVVGCVCVCVCETSAQASAVSRCICTHPASDIMQNFEDYNVGENCKFQF